MQEKKALAKEIQELEEMRKKRQELIDQGFTTPQRTQPSPARSHRTVNYEPKSAPPSVAPSHVDENGDESAEAI